MRRPASVMLAVLANFRVSFLSETNFCQSLKTDDISAHFPVVNEKEYRTIEPGASSVRTTNSVMIPNPAAAPFNAQKRSEFCDSDARTMLESASTTLCLTDASGLLSRAEQNV